MTPPKTVVIPKSQAVFHLDRHGRWHNAHGPFEHPKIIAHFHRAIRRDNEGYYLFQDHGTHVEKVYFPYEDTALFVWDLEIGDTLRITLNTGELRSMDPAGLAARGEDLYYFDGGLAQGEAIKFTERPLMKLAVLLIESDQGLCLKYNNLAYLIADLAQ